MSEKKRDGFTSGLGFVLAVMGFDLDFTDLNSIL